MSHLTNSLWLGAVVAWGGLMASAAGETTVDLSTALIESAQNNPSLTALRRAEEAARLRYRQALGNYGPQVAGSASYDRSGATLLASPGTDRFAMGVEARQTLFDGLKSQATVAQRRAQWEATLADLDRARASLRSEASTALGDLLFAQENETLAQRIEWRRKENLDLIRLRFEAGREHKGSLLRLQAAHRQAEFDVAQAARDRSVAQARLAQVMGRSLEEPLTATGSWSALMGPLPRGAPFFAALTEATPEMRKAQAQRRSARAAQTVAQSEFFPTIDATLSHRWADEQWPPSSRSWTGGVALSVPFWTSGTHYFGVRAARAERTQAEASWANTRAQTQLALRSAWADWQGARERVEVQDEFVAAALLRALIARGQYTSGLLTFENWDLIENDLIQEQKQQLSVRRQALRDRSAWESAQGVVE